MTHTLHRFGRRADLAHDFIVSVMPAKGINDADAVEKQRAFVRAALKYHPVNVGDSKRGAAFRPSKTLNPTAHWRRDAAPHPNEVVEDMDQVTTVSAVFDNYEAVRSLVAELKELDLGLSVNISGLPEEARRCCEECHLVRHSVEYSLGFQGRTERLTDDRTLLLTSMCGHGMVGAGFARKMQEWVRAGRRTPKEAATYMARFCVCGSFNPARAEDILGRVAEGR